MTGAFPPTLARPSSFCLSEKHNTFVILTPDGWYNSDTETVHPFDSYTGMYYDGLALQIIHNQAAAAIEAARTARPEWDNQPDDVCSCYDLPDGRGYVCPVCQDANADAELPY